MFSLMSMSQDTVSEDWMEGPSWRAYGPGLHMYTVYVCVFMIVCMRGLLYMLAALQHPTLDKHGEDFCWGKQELLGKRGNLQFRDWNSDNVAHYEDFKLQTENTEHQTINTVNKQPQWQHGLSPLLPSVLIWHNAIMFQQLLNEAKCAKWNVELIDSFLTAVNMM